MRHSLSESDFLHYSCGEPLAALSKWLTDARINQLLLVDFELACWWLPVTKTIPLTAIYYCDGQGELHCAVTDKSLVADRESAAAQFERWLQSMCLASFRQGKPLQLMPVHIPKPWGREIWFTGIEARGVCCFGDGRREAPIPWVQAMMPAACAGEPGQPLVLLKILDPLPEEVTGDLYFELHEEKREVYVVTHVDEQAWPGGAGGIRFGFDSQKIAQADSEQGFRHDYLQAVHAYERVRREIDAIAAESEPTADLTASEARLRETMNDFTHMRSLRVADVVVVPLLMPHSLQHGVRTIEFQTPVYERQILSFAQRVLTQEHWDTADAVSKMRLLPPPEADFLVLPASPGVLVERIVDFPDFEVRRLRFARGSSEHYRVAESYALVMVVEGQITLGDLDLGPEDAAYLPADNAVVLRSSKAAEPLVLLLALPRR